MDSIFLQAFEGPTKTIPVWFMRQAGRYLPEYRKLKEKFSLTEMFQTPMIASEITCQPIQRIGVDAAILFADILTLPGAMGFDIRFDDKRGPLIGKLPDFSKVHDFDDLSYISETIQLVNQRLPKNIPLIGFAGSPFTVLTYLVEGSSSINYTKTFEFMYTQPNEFHRLMKLLTANTIKYLKLQKTAGIKAFQLFDSWGGILRPADYAHYVLPYVKEIFDQVDLPSIYYMRNCSHLLNLMDQTSADFLSVCHTVVLGHQKTIEKTQKGIQGNLFNGLLLSNDKSMLKKEVNDVVVGGKKHTRFIFNLSHGVFPSTDPDILKFVTETVHAING
jgi:uroporphyrinogen decarboxylase